MIVIFRNKVDSLINETRKSNSLIFPIYKGSSEMKIKIVKGRFTYQHKGEEGASVIGWCYLLAKDPPKDELSTM